eukprot:6193740-Pleurochrysis_carterae.AAC.2
MAARPRWRRSVRDVASVRAGARASVRTVQCNTHALCCSFASIGRVLSAAVHRSKGVRSSCFASCGCQSPRICASHATAFSAAAAAAHFRALLCGCRRPSRRAEHVLQRPRVCAPHADGGVVPSGEEARAARAEAHRRHRRSVRVALSAPPERRTPRRDQIVEQRLVRFGR